MMSAVVTLNAINKKKHTALDLVTIKAQARSGSLCTIDSQTATTAAVGEGTKQPPEAVPFLS